VEKIRAYLVSRAAAGDPDNLLSATVVYSKLAKEVPEAGFKGPRYTGIGHALDQINRFEHQHGRPMLSALVVRITDMGPGDGFYLCARNLGYNVPVSQERDFWRAEVRKVIEHWAA